MLLPVIDGADLAEALYARMRWNIPLSLVHADLLLERLDLRPGLRIADIGCGWGELLLQAVSRAMGPGAAADDADAGQVSGFGVDTDAAALARARDLARERGLDRRVGFAEDDVAAWRETADRVLCTGAAHAFGGTRAALTALAPLVPGGGRLLFGDCYWSGPPSPAAVELFGDQVLPLPDLLEACRAQGWRVIHLSVSDQREWDDFESTFRAGRQEWLIAHGDDPRAAEVCDWIDAREREYLQVYRDVLGFAYLVLAH
jgi:cyclopropane fatty-acyl-phospholipid synthase-like methyltransferase